MGLFKWLKKQQEKELDENQAIKFEEKLDQQQFDEEVAEIRWIMLLDDGFQIVDQTNILLKKKWNDIKDCLFSKSHINITDTENKEHIIPNHFEGWFELAQNIPTQFSNYNLEHLQEVIKTLKDCPVCGLVSLQDHLCLNCKTNFNDFEQELRFADFAAFVRNIQLHYFSPLEGGVLDLVVANKNGFEKSDVWKCQVSEADYIEGGLKENSTGLIHKGEFLIERGWKEITRSVYKKDNIEIIFRNSGDIDIKTIDSDIITGSFYANTVDDLHYLLQDIACGSFYKS